MSHVEGGSYFEKPAASMEFGNTWKRSGEDEINGEWGTQQYGTSDSGDLIIHDDQNDASEPST